MKAFVLTRENFVIAFPSVGQLPTDSDQLERINSEEDLLRFTAGWPAARLIAIWNNLHGTTPVKKFTDRKTAVSRIWRAMQILEPGVAPVATETTSAEGTGTGKPNQKGNRVTAPRTRTHAQGVAQRSTKKAAVVELLRRPTGVTLVEIMEATGWQAHSVRGFLSGAIANKMGLKVSSSKRPDGERNYSITTE